MTFDGRILIWRWNGSDGKAIAVPGALAPLKTTTVPPIAYLGSEPQGEKRYLEYRKDGLFGIFRDDGVDRWSLYNKKPSIPAQKKTKSGNYVGWS